MHASTEPQTTEPQTTEPQATEPQIGDVVELKSGGPRMTIAGLEYSKFSQGSYALDAADVRSVTCLWFDQSECRTGEFIPQTLRLLAR